MDSTDTHPAPAFWSRRARRVASVLLTCEHASQQLDAGLKSDEVGRRLLRSHWGFDLGGWALARDLSRLLNASLVGGAGSRLAIDLNRAPGDPTLARPVAGDTPIPWNRRLSVRHLWTRIEAWHAPYHAEVERRIVSHLLRGVRPLALSVHTFTLELDGIRRSFEIGVLFREHESLGRALARHIRMEGLSVRLNQPYSGLDGLMYSAERHGTHHGLPCLELEVNQALFGKRGAAPRLTAAVSRAVSGRTSSRS